MNQTETYKMFIVIHGLVTLTDQDHIDDEDHLIIDDERMTSIIKDQTLAKKNKKRDISMK